MRNPFLHRSTFVLLPLLLLWFFLRKVLSFQKLPPTCTPARIQVTLPHSNSTPLHPPVAHLCCAWRQAIFARHIQLLCPYSMRCSLHSLTYNSPLTCVHSFCISRPLLCQSYFYSIDWWWCLIFHAAINNQGNLEGIHGMPVVYPTILHSTDHTIRGKEGRRR